MRDKKSLEKMTEAIECECIAFRVRLLNRAVTALYDDALRGAGLTASQFGLLVLVSRMKKATAKEVSHILLMDPSTVSRNLERMRREGWLSGNAAEDARYQELMLTDKGLRLLQKAQPGWKKAQKQIRRLLGEKNTAAIKSVVDGIMPKARFA